MAARTDRRKRAAVSSSVERDSGTKKRKPSGDIELPQAGPSHTASTSRTVQPEPSTSKSRPPETVKVPMSVPATGKNKLTRQLFEQIPFLEVDPLKALEMLKKMVQESGLETLYNSVNENAARARDFSDRILELKKSVETILKSMLNSKTSEQDKIDKYKEMKTIWSKIHGLNEAKVKLTQGAYDMVDRVIRRLDKELESINSEINSGKASSANSGPRSKGSGNMGPGDTRRGGGFDMPVDPNEPTYCECKQISYGEMIACDNVHCPVEWFHFSCVGLTSKPKGKWYCKRCVASGQNKTGKKKKGRIGIIEKYASASDKSEVEHMLSGSDSE